jgi:hypothetical protein
MTPLKDSGGAADSRIQSNIDFFFCLQSSLLLVNNFYEEVPKILNSG